MEFSENILSQGLVQRLGWTLVHFVWQAGMVALLLAILLKLLRKFSANLRYIVACLALLIVVLIPAITMNLIPVTMSYSAKEFEPEPAAITSTPVTIEQFSNIEAPVIETQLPVENVTVSPRIPFRGRITEALEPFLPYVVLGWLVGVFGLSVWHLGGWTQLQRLRRRMVKPVNEPLRSKLKELAGILGVHRVVQLMESALVQAPTAVGWLKPVILLPASVLTGFSADQLEAILAHELAHIKRYDYLVNMLQTVVEILGFYHPAVWWVSKRIRVERENCCDDIAVMVSGDSIGYAKTLASFEEIQAGQPELAVAASGSNLLRRIRRLVSKDSTDSSRAGWIPSAITILLIAIIVIPTTLALTTNDKTEHSAQFLLDKMLKHSFQVRNLQYVVEEQTWYDQDPTDWEIKRMEDNIKRRIKEGAPVRSIRFSEGAIGQLKIGQLQNPNKDRYKIIKCTIDNEGRSKYEKYLGAWDSSGKIELNGNEYIKAWNGVQCIVYTQERGYSKATIQDTASSDDNPWRTLMIYLCQYLQESIEAKRDVSVEKLKDGTYRIAFDYKTRKIVAVIDPSKGYTCALRENHQNGQLSSRLTATYEEIVEGIWFPVSGQLETFFSDSPNFKRSFKSSQISINGPAFNTSYFDVDMPDGTTVTDEAHGKQYVVGSKRVHDLNVPQNSSDEAEDIDPNSWREKFYSIYRLEDGEVLKRMAPPFIPERRGYFKFIQPGRYSPTIPYHHVSLYFNWDGKLSTKSGRARASIQRLSEILRSVIGLSNREYDIPRGLLSTDMSGDWIVRKDTPQEELLQALEQLIKEETGRDINFVKQKVETEVIVVRGEYSFTPLPDAKNKDAVQVFTDKMDTYYDVGVVRRTLSELLSSVERSIDMDIIDETESGDVELSWSEHYAMMLFTLIYNEQLYNERVDMLLNNLARQTGLTFERTKATVEKWLITEEGVDKSLL